MKQISEPKGWRASILAKALGISLDDARAIKKGTMTVDQAQQNARRPAAHEEFKSKPEPEKDGDA